MARPTAIATNAIQPRIARQGCSALQRAAFIGTAVSGLPMAVSPGIGRVSRGASSLRWRTAGVRGAGTRTTVVPAPLRGIGSAREDVPVSTTPETPKRPGPFLLTGYAVAQLGLSVALLVLFVLSVVGGVLAVLWVGLVILIAVIPAGRAIANVHRRMTARVLESPVPDPYRPVPGGFFPRLRAYATDPMTWRDLAWMPVAFVVSFTINLTVIILALGVVTWIIWWFATPWLMRARASIDRF